MSSLMIVIKGSEQSKKRTQILANEIIYFKTW